MPKVKIPRKSTNIDMTAMCDVAFLLLTFFMLTTKFKPEEPVYVDMPKSVSEIKLPETDIVTITVDTSGRVFFGADSQITRRKALEEVSKAHNVQFTEEQIRRFSLLEIFGTPIEQLPSLLTMSTGERAAVHQPGIPVDSTADNRPSQLSEWIWYARVAHNNELGKDVRFAIKADGGVNMPEVQRVIQILQDRNINKFNLVTSLEAAQ